MKILLFANTDWYLYNFRLPLAEMLRERGAEVTLLSPPGEYAGRLAAKGFRWVAFPMSSGGTNPFAELITLLRLWKSYRAEKPDLVHHFTPKCVLYGSLAARWSGIRAVVNSVTGLGYLFTRRRSWGRLVRGLVSVSYRFAMRGTQVIFQNSEDMRAFVAGGLVAAEVAHLVRSSGVELERFAVLPEPEGIPVVMLAARMLWEKGVGDFVEAARVVNKADITAHFVLVGDTYSSNPSAVPAEQLSRWQAEGIAEWWGWHDDMPAVLARANVVCLPTYYGEGVPKVLVEAAACGRAIVASDIPGCREVVRHGENGLLVPQRNPAALAEAISTLAGDVGMRRIMGANGRKIAEQQFSVEKVNQSTLMVYAWAGQSDIL
jgi:glycosyltransferase involved in cell wall biosynthesis